VRLKTGRLAQPMPACASWRVRSDYGIAGAETGNNGQPRGPRLVMGSGAEEGARAEYVDVGSAEKRSLRRLAGAAPAIPKLKHGRGVRAFCFGTGQAGIPFSPGRLKEAVSIETGPLVEAREKTGGTQERPAGVGCECTGGVTGGVLLNGIRVGEHHQLVRPPAPAARLISALCAADAQSRGRCPTQSRWRAS
jgi:hypothetical protein